MSPKKIAHKASTSTLHESAPEHEPISFIQRVVRGLLLFFAVTLPLYYDLSVPEVSGDIRWAATSFFSGLCALLLLVDAFIRRKQSLTFRWPPIFWFAIGLAVWAAISLVDALNWMRGIILIKAMYAQLVLIVVVALVATPAFIRRLMWALVLPLAFTSFLGICQFKGWTTETFQIAVSQSWLFFWMAPLFDAFGWLLHKATFWVPNWPDSDDLITQLTGYFQQSAVPGSTFANKNLAGSWTAMMLPMCLYLLVTSRRISGQAVASFLLAIGSLFLVYARARASWAALFAGILTLGALLVIVPAWRQAIARHMDWKHLLWLMLPVAVLVKWAGDTSPVTGSYAIDRTPGQQVRALAESSWDEIGGRLAYNLNSVAITRDYWFNGVGLGSFFVAFPAYYDAVVVPPVNSYSVAARPQRTHTDLMQAFDEMGVPGGIFYAGVFICALVAAFRLGGRRAAGLAGKLIGAGLTSAILMLVALLEFKNMLAFPSPWGGVVQLGLGLLALAFLVLAGIDAYRVQKETKPADDNQLLGLMAGIGVLTICVNALMDFPMQLPTAPAVAALLMGAITALGMRYNPRMVWGPKRTFNVPTPLIAAGVMAVAATWLVFLWDDVRFRNGNVLLKQGMVRIYSGLNDDITLDVLNQAYKAYPYDPRIHENLAIVYANYRGSQIMPLEARIEKLEWVLSGDYWGPSHIINISGQYLQLIEQKQIAGDVVSANKMIAHMEELYARLQRSAGFSHYTWGIGGMLRLLEGQPEEAASLFRRALSIDPTYQPAIQGLAVAVQRSKVKPIEVKDKITDFQSAIPVSQ